MDLSSPLRTLVPSLDSAVLEVLASSQSSFGTTQVTRLAGRGSRQGIQLVLDRLVAHGLVLAEPTNRGFVYELNRAHLLADVVLAALRVRSELVARLRDRVARLNPVPEHASIFGSFARGGGGPESDIDLLLVTPAGFAGGHGWEEQLRLLEDEVLAWTGNRLETVVLDVDGLDRAVQLGEALIDELRRDALTVVGVDFGRVISTPAEPIGSTA